MLHVSFRPNITRSLARQKQRQPQLLTACFSTESEHHSNSTTDVLPPPPLPSKSRTSQHGPGLTPRKFGQDSWRDRRGVLPSLPANFGQNQLLPVPNSTRALLESIVAQFEAPIRYAFAYGSGVFEQDGYKKDEPNPPMLDFIFAINHPAHWHSINLHQHASHYSLHSRLLGSGFISKVQSISPGIWYNAFVKINDVDIKYGVTTLDNLCTDLLNWRSLYLAGRMHKPIRIIKDDARVRLTQQVNLTSALRVALLGLPERFEERELYEKMASISYLGDPRMWLPTENRGKVGNIVRAQSVQFKDLYRRLAVGLPGVNWPVNSSVITQDLSAAVRANHLRKLPSELSNRLNTRWERDSDETAHYLKIASDPNLAEYIQADVTSIVRGPATVQSAKGLISAGVGQSMRYTAGKITKWWKGSGKLMI